jgi:molybdopterin converting factor small subunit
MSTPAPLRVLILGPLRDQLEDGTQAAFWKALGDRFPIALPKHLRLARENEFLPADATLNPGDELALIPPVSGG